MMYYYMMLHHNVYISPTNSKFVQTPSRSHREGVVEQDLKLVQEDNTSSSSSSSSSSSRSSSMRVQPI